MENVFPLHTKYINWWRVIWPAVVEIGVHEVLLVRHRYHCVHSNKYFWAYVKSNFLMFTKSIPNSDRPAFIVFCHEREHKMSFCATWRINSSSLFCYRSKTLQQKAICDKCWYIVYASTEIPTDICVRRLTDKGNEFVSLQIMQAEEYYESDSSVNECEVLALGHKLDCSDLVCAKNIN